MLPIPLHFRKYLSGLARLPLRFDLGVAKQETIGGDRVRFLGAMGSPCRLPDAILWLFSMREE